MNTEQQKLITRYEQFDPTIKKIVQVAAVAKPMARTSLIELSVKAGVTHENGRTQARSRLVRRIRKTDRGR